MTTHTIRGAERSQDERGDGGAPRRQRSGHRDRFGLGALGPTAGQVAVHEDDSQAEHRYRHRQAGHDGEVGDVRLVLGPQGDDVQPGPTAAHAISKGMLP